jgi:hypothetical protein
MSHRVSAGGVAISGHRGLDIDQSAAGIRYGNAGSNASARDRRNTAVRRDGRRQHQPMIALVSREGLSAPQ